MNLERSSGILVHPTSFPSKYGIGDLGEGAKKTIDFLYESKQKLWQVLPLSPTGFGDSPYQSFSTFAGNSLLICPDILVSEGYLTKKDLENVPEFDPLLVDYGKVINYKNGLYEKAYENFSKNATNIQVKKYKEFCADNSFWLDDFALFVAIKNYYIDKRKMEFKSTGLNDYAKKNKEFLTEEEINDYYYGAVWNSWDSELVVREKKAIETWTKKLFEKIEFYKFLQYEFNRQWANIKEYANSLGIKIIGDIPIFVAMDSADTWANPELFHINKTGYPTVVAGVPPDYFSLTGQLWGNPLYNWENHKKTNYKWWILRIKKILDITDMLRIDHFRGFESYWEIKYGSKTAEKGKWVNGPNIDLFKAIEKELGEIPIIAEDLGIITPEVDELRVNTGFPGMKVLQFAFDKTSVNVYQPHNYDSVNCVVYTGTHDNNTTKGWYNTAPESEKDHVRRYLNISGDNISWDLIRLASSSTANYAIFTIQDILELGEEGRMNTPGIAIGNWQFRFTLDQLNKNQSEKLAYLTLLFNRIEEEIETETKTKEKA